MASTTEELTAQADQLVGALGFFRTEDVGRAVSPTARPAASLRKVQAALGHSVAPSTRKPSKSGVNLKMKETGDAIDREFERY
jgi:hypothetical protein